MSYRIVLFYDGSGVTQYDGVTCSPVTHDDNTLFNGVAAPMINI